jgi:hypothetical protein
MSIEIADTAAVMGADERGVPRRSTNMRDLQNEAALPPAKVAIDCPPGYTHGAPDTHTPYETGPKSLPQEDGDAQR